MSIIENNKLLAEFLGWHSKKINVTASRPKGDGIEMYLKEVTEYNREFIDNELKFHTDWNWIMPVVEKILDISLNLDTMEMYYEITDSIPRLDHVHEACVMFVKWYNENK
jgi:hypothetical protein